MHVTAGDDASHARQRQADLAPVRIKADIASIGTDDPMIATAQECWRKLQAAKAANLVQVVEPDDLLSHQSNSVTEDLAMILLAVHVGDDAALVMAQKRLGEHLRKL